ncbi:hypothetical protein GCM10008164_03800 [Achromobacter xylosoxidans]|nr:hypothetical protein GCM10008164_03800 [Achromobacter xylosoxidans]
MAMRVGAPLPSVTVCCPLTDIKISRAGALALAVGAVLCARLRPPCVIAAAADKRQIMVVR